MREVRLSSKAALPTADSFGDPAWNLFIVAKHIAAKTENPAKRSAGSRTPGRKQNAMTETDQPSPHVDRLVNTWRKNGCRLR